MKTIDEIHRLNLAALVEEFKGVVRLSELIGRSSAQVSQWLNGSTNSSTGKPRGMGPASCRMLEKACGKPIGWMDLEHAANDAQEAPREAASARVDAPAQLQWVTPAEAALLSNYRSVSNKGRGMIDNLANGLDKAGILGAAGKQD